MFNKLQKNEKNKVISFDTFEMPSGESIAVRTVYNVYNDLYSNDKFANIRLTDMDILNRRLALKDIFHNRIKFLLHNLLTISNLRQYCYAIEDLEQKYPYIFDIFSYMADITSATIVDFSAVICTELYNIASLHYDEEAETIVAHNDSLLSELKRLQISICDMLTNIHIEAVNIYLPAGEKF